MRIAINLIPFYSVQGIEIYAQSIVSELIKLGIKDEFFVLGSEDSLNLFNLPGANFIKIKQLEWKYGKFFKAFYLQFGIYFLLRKYKINILFSPSVSAPIFYKKKVVVIHDCAYDRFPEFSNLLSKIYFRIMFLGAKYFSKKIITVSNFSKKELVELYKINPNKIEVLYEGIPELPKADEDFIQKTLNKFKIKNPYFLYVGNWRPRKNILGLFKAFKIFVGKTNLDFLLVIGGKKDKRFLNLEKEIQRNKLQNRVILTDTLTREEISALYRSSDILAFPSFYEGFGLPVLEAQSLGIPVLTSDTSSLPEVAGGAALYVNPYNVEEIAQGLQKIALDKTLRQDLIQNGFENIKRFSWEKSAQQLLNVFHYEDLASK